MNGPDDSPLDLESAAELVARAIVDIDASNDEYRDLLLSDLVCAAWGTVLARSQ